MGELYRYWNQRVNLISRKDIDNLWLHHILHSLAIAKVIRFSSGTTILDAGTGGGFPGIPLAVMFPESTFTLADSIAKKINIVKEIQQGLNLQNVIPVNCRVEKIREKFDFVTGRAVTDLAAFIRLVRKLVKPESLNEIPNRILYLTGGEIDMQSLNSFTGCRIINLSGFFNEPWFDTKKLVSIRV